MMRYAIPFLSALSLLLGSLCDAELSGIKLLITATIGWNHEIFLMEGLEGKPVRLTDNPAFDAHPRWAPDGEKLVFTSDRDGNRELYILDLKSGEMRKLTSSDEEDDYPVWSPDGRWIAFASFLIGRPDTLKLSFLDPLRGRKVQLKDDLGLLPFAWRRDGLFLYGPKGIYKLDPLQAIREGRLKAEMIRPRPEQIRVFGCFGISMPLERDLVVLADSDWFNRFDLYLMNLRDGGLIKLTNDKAKDMSPCFTPDGRFIFFISNRKGCLGGGDIYIMGDDGRIVRQLKLDLDEAEVSVYDPAYDYFASPLLDLKPLTWGVIKRKGGR